VKRSSINESSGGDIDRTLGGNSSSYGKMKIAVEASESNSVSITSEIAEVLASWPLYRQFKYTGDARLVEHRDGPPPSGGSFKYLMLPPELNLFCETCKKDQRWKCDERRIPGSGGYSQKSYVCKNCGRSRVTYFILWKQDGKQGCFLKVGQDPPLSILPPIELKLALDDLELYKKGLTSRNNAFGIGALAYLRRVVENRMNELLDLVAEAAKVSGNMSPERTANLSDVRRIGSFEDKAKLAGAILPNQLKPGGHNPFDILCKFASEGLHDQSDHECIAVFDEVKLVFEYLFRELTVQSEDAKRFIEGLSHLAGRKPGRKVPEKQQERSKAHDGDELAKHQEP